MRLLELVETSGRVTATSRRLDKVEELAALLRRLPPEEIEIAVGCLSGTPRQGRFGAGWAVISEARQAPPAAVAALSLADVDAELTQLAAARGPGSAQARRERLTALFARATAAEQDYLIRLLTGDLRQGALEGVLAEAVARAVGAGAGTLRRAAMMAGDLGTVARAALVEGETALARFSLQLLRPVQPMLAESADDVAEAVDELGDASLEWKLDGARIQVHKAGDEVRVFSRQLREVTSAVPEVVELTRALPPRELILDGEVIALRADGMPEPFQVTMRRFGRKLDIDRLRQDLPLSPFFFDCLYVDGAPLVDEPQARRFGALLALAPPARVVPHITGVGRVEAEAFYAEAIRRGHEGVMAKAPGAPYAAGSRGRAWLKVKAAHTLDLVVLAAEWGHGRRRGWLSNLHLGARDPERGAFVMLGKTFKGLTDEVLAWQTAQLLAREIARDAYTVHVRPELVVEVAFSDVQASPRYPGGLALRLARVKRYRPEKPAPEADTLGSVQAIFARSTGTPPPPRR